MTEVAGKVAVITGAGAGMGRAAALHFANQGAKVVALDISGAQETVAAQFPDSVIALHCDVSDEGQVEEAIATAVSRFGRLDAMLNVAGFGIPSMLADADLADFDRMASVNLRGVIHGTKHAIRAMSKTGGGTILNWSSNAAFGATPIWGLYASTKAGIVAITKAAAVEYASIGIRANVIAPGTVVTEAFVHMPKEMADQLQASIPAGRFGQTQEVAELAAFLASDRAKFLTGAVIPIDGAQSARLA